MLQPEQDAAERNRIRSRTEMPKNRSDERNFLIEQNAEGKP
jgi:hypothetical protein